AGFLHDRLFVTGGAARVWAGVREYSLPYINKESVQAGNLAGPVVLKTFSHTTNALMPTVEPRHDTYVAGILYKVLPNVSAYYNFSTNAGLASLAPMWQAGKQNEFGLKSSFIKNRISVTVDHFAITQSNVAFQNPLFNLGQSSIQNIYQALSSKGEELNVVGGLTKDLSVVMSYTNQKLRDPFGRRPRNIPDQMANLLLNYHFSSGTWKDASVFIGLNYCGNVAGETVTANTSLGVPELPGYYVAAYTVTNAGASYRWGKYRFNLNVHNLFDQKFWWQAQARSSLLPYSGTQVTLTMTVRL
ncbi:MAG: TonB-dependent receptor domain-containing protein, partial [Opitutales bacterium]